jgi:ABC-type multidrug transport system fused ATPase/permease subunit
MKKNNIFSKFKLIFFKKNNYIFTKVFDILGKKQIYFSIILISFLGIIASIISSLTPLLLQDVINKLEVLLKESDEDKKLFHDFFLSFFVILSLSIIKFLFCDVPGMILVCYIDQTNGFKLRKKMVEKISKLPFSYFSKVSQGKFFSLFIHDIYIISSSFIGAIANI